MDQNMEQQKVQMVAGSNVLKRFGGYIRINGLKTEPQKKYPSLDGYKVATLFDSTIT
ncbi:MAG: hypothetical protein HOP10_08085 [Chitinophagaceae bacterium]|nr:hypothetical protein [Chitinophagaceae bacterium]